MTRIVAGVFDDERAATALAHELRGAGFEAGDLDQFALNPPGRHNALPPGGDEDEGPKAATGEAGALTGAAIGSALGAAAGLAAMPLIGPAAIAGGAAAGAYAGSLTGAVNRMGDARPAPETRPAGVMVAVNTEFAEDEEIAVDLMRDHTARMIERADGVWRNGKWTDFDPVRPPDVIGGSAHAGAAGATGTPA